MNKILTRLGLSKKEANFYLALLELGEANLHRISKKSKIKRTTAYDVASSLKEKGLINSTSRNKKAFYSAEDPRILKDQLKEREALLDKALPQLLSITNLIDRKPKVKFFEGSEGIKDILQDMLKQPGREICGWYGETFHVAVELDFFLNYFIPQRLKKRIWIRAIAPDSDQMRDFKKEDANQLRKTKLISAKNFPIKSSILLYGRNKIGILAFEEQIGLVVESEKIFITLKSIFELNWKSLPE